MQVDKKQAGRGSVWFAVYEELLFALGADFSVLTFILLLKKKKKKIRTHQFTIQAW